MNKDRKAAVLFATSGGHFSEMLQWSQDLECNLLYIIDGPNVPSSPNVVGIKKIDGIADAILAVPFLMRNVQLRRADFFISGGAQNALTAWCLSVILRRHFYYVESFQRTSDLSKAGWFSLFFAQKVFLYHDVLSDMTKGRAWLVKFTQRKVIMIFPKFSVEK